MKKNNKVLRSTKKSRVTPVEESRKLEMAIEFLDQIRRIPEDKDEKTQLISVRVPQNLLRALKLKAQFDNRKYQSMIVQFIRQGLSKK